MSSSDDELGYEDEEEVAPHRPPVRAGRVRICLAGRSRLCAQTGYAAKLIRAIVDANDSNYESWFYFERQRGVYNAFVDKVKRELNEDQRSKFSKRSVRAGHARVDDYALTRSLTLSCTLSWQHCVDCIPTACCGFTGLVNAFHLV